MIRVRVPATSANMGSGFDCAGIALNLFHRITAEESDDTMIDAGNPMFNNKDNLVYQSMLRCFNELGYRPKGIHLTCDSRIPHSRGLGSSAACIVAGIAGAASIAGIEMSRGDMLALAARIEGHPDNVAPAIHGGMVVSFREGDRILHEKIQMKNRYKFIALVPDFPLSTEKSRSVLPKTVPFKDSVFNISRASLMIAGFQNGSNDTLRCVFEDRLHEPYRGPLIDSFDRIKVLSKELGCIGVFLSGAGPTIMTLVEQENQNFEQSMRQELHKNHPNWAVVPLELDDQGVLIE